MLNPKTVANTRREEYTLKKLKKYMIKYGLEKSCYGLNERKASAGITHYLKNKSNGERFVLIELSKNYINSKKKVKREDIKNTILHEIAHALVGHKEGHNKVWKDKAIEIGCTGDRCCQRFYEISEYKYNLICEEGCKIPRHRLSKKFKDALKKKGLTCGKHKKSKLTLKVNF